MWFFLFSAFVAVSTPAFARQSCVGNPAQVVDDVYQQVLDRRADPASAELTQALARGQLSVRGVVNVLASSPEYEERFFWPPVVAAVYRQMLQRPPTTAEVRSAAFELTRGGVSPAAFVAHVATRAANNNPEAIRMVYRRLLGREPDPEGLAAYTAMAQRDGLDAVTRSIVTSPEYRQRSTPNGIPLQMIDAYGQSVRALYQRVLGRDADPDGLLALTELATVYGIKEPVHRMVNSPEYRQRYGENGIPGRNVQFCGAGDGGRVALPRR